MVSQIMLLVVEVMMFIAFVFTYLTIKETSKRVDLMFELLTGMLQELNKTADLLKQTTSMVDTQAQLLDGYREEIEKWTKN